MRCSQPSITALEKSLVYAALDQSEIGQGGFIGQFESRWAEWNGKRFGVACNSGTNALYLALKALGIGPGDQVIVPEFTMVATAWAVSYTGAIPVFADCGDDLNIEDFQVTRRTKAIVPVAVYGRAVSDHIYRKAKMYGLRIIEDLAEGHGIQPRGDVACYSFYANKILSTGEGGMCLTNSEDLAGEIRRLANMYFDEQRTLVHPKIGHNFRMTNLQAAVGYAQVSRIDSILEKRRQIENWYDAHIPKAMRMPQRDVLWQYDIDCGDRQAEIKSRLEAAGIESRYFFKPMSRQPMYLQPYKHLNAHKWSERGLYLPTFTDMTEDQVVEVCEVLQEAA